ncbi:MAG: aldolase/citrate lyase family protein [Pyrinomonadaceae bacterium]
MTKITLSADVTRQYETRVMVEPTCSSDNGTLQPVHVVYGGAHLFRADTAQKLGRLALRSLEQFATEAESFTKALDFAVGGQGSGVGEITEGNQNEPPRPQAAPRAEAPWQHTLTKEGSFAAIYERVVAKLKREPVEDYRIDFEDGYGIRPAAEEDEHALSAANAVAEGMRHQTLPRFIGLRIKALNAESPRRGIRTLDIFLTSLLESTGGVLPDGFVVTLPKVEHENQVSALVQACDALEAALGLQSCALKLEVMVESPRALFGADGGAALPRFLQAAKGRLRGAHFGAFDYTAACNISANLQDIRHPQCDFARSMMQASLAGTGVWLSDSVTTVMPVAVNRGTDLTDAQREENRRSVHSAWRTHYENIRHSLENGFYQSWDLHPAQLPVRYAAVQVFFRENLAASAARLSTFVKRATQATMSGNQFDDAATAQGLLNFFAQALASDVIDEGEATDLTGLSGDQLRGRSFAKIMENRSQQLPSVAKER